MSASSVGRRRARIGMLVYALAIIAMSLAIVSLIAPTWLERTFEMSPDNGSGETEWAVVAVFAVASGVLAYTGRRLRTFASASATQ